MVVVLLVHIDNGIGDVCGSCTTKTRDKTNPVEGENNPFGGIPVRIRWARAEVVGEGML